MAKHRSHIIEFKRQIAQEFTNLLRAIRSALPRSGWPATFGAAALGSIGGLTDQGHMGDGNTGDHIWSRTT